MKAPSQIVGLFEPAPKQRAARQVQAIKPAMRVRGRYHPISEAQVKSILLARFGSLTSFENPICSIYSVSQRLRIPYSSVQETIKKFLERGRQFAFKFKKGRKRKELAPNLEAQLCSQELLQDWSSYSLRDRVTLCQRRFNLKISVTTLRRLYRCNGIRYRASQKVYRTALTHQERIRKQRLEFVMLLANLIARKADIIYVGKFLAQLTYQRFRRVIVSSLYPSAQRSPLGSTAGCTRPQAGHVPQSLICITSTTPATVSPSLAPSASASSSPSSI